MRSGAPAEADSPASGREHYPLRAVDLLAIISFWTFLALIAVAARELDPRIPGIAPRVMAGVLRAMYAEYAIWAVCTVPIWWLASRYYIEGGRRVGRVLLFLLLGVILAVVIDTVMVELRQQLAVDASGLRRRPPTPLIGFGFVDDLMVYFAVLGSGIARDYFLRYHTHLEESARLQRQLGQARLDTLRAQINPHFLFNTLNAVSALAERDPRGARRMIARLSDLLRYTLDEATDKEVPLHRELELLGEYIELMQIRFQGKLAVSVDVDESARDALVPNLILQPIVENAIKHGVSRAAGPGRIELRARREGDRLVVTVTDNGPGPSPGPEGHGMRSTNERLREMYGEAHAVVLRPSAGNGGGTEAEVVIPYHEETVERMR